MMLAALGAGIGLTLGFLLGYLIRARRKNRIRGGFVETAFASTGSTGDGASTTSKAAARKNACSDSDPQIDQVVNLTDSRAATVVDLDVARKLRGKAKALDRHAACLWRRSKELEARGRLEEAISLWRQGLRIYEYIMRIHPKARESCKAMLGPAYLDMAEKLAVQDKPDSQRRAAVHCKTAVRYLEMSVEAGVYENQEALARAERLLEQLRPQDREEALLFDDSED